MTRKPQLALAPRASRNATPLLSRPRISGWSDIDTHATASGFSTDGRHMEVTVHIETATAPDHPSEAVFLRVEWGDSDGNRGDFTCDDFPIDLLDALAAATQAAIGRARLEGLFRRADEFRQELTGTD